mmetsp:Transcript_96045/g.165796  ORF Transcript_96045/g.165796 Transcript_96045/m.165796 type:complete len:108 (+) Transcript_96045:10-333(+)
MSLDAHSAAVMASTRSQVMQISVAETGSMHSHSLPTLHSGASLSAACTSGRIEWLAKSLHQGPRHKCPTNTHPFLEANMRWRRPMAEGRASRLLGGVFCPCMQMSRA